MRRLTIEDFLQKSISIHGYFFDYSKVIYANCKTPVLIGCPKPGHGYFEQTPENHWNHKTGCKKCIFENSFKTTEEFIKEAREVHGDKYDYSKVIYTSSVTPVLIGCPEHGYFEQIPRGHLQEQGCKKCGRVLTGQKLLRTLDEFIKEAREVHGDKYDYSKFIYVNNDTKGLIRCHKHGYFEQTPRAHLEGKGCSSCKESHGEKTIAKYLNELKLPHKREYKNEKCRDKQLLPFDFIVSISKGYGFLIEYHGKQHYEPCNFGSKKITPEQCFEKVKERDRIKKEFCEKNNIPLLIIPYWNFDKVEDLIMEFMFKVAFNNCQTGG